MIKQFRNPASIEEAISLKEELGEEAYFLAGGTYLNSRGSKSAPEELISIDLPGLDKISVSDTEIAIGAMCTAQNLIDNENTPKALKDSAKGIMSRNIRNMATIGGNIASRKSESDIIAILIALDAKVELANSKGWENLSVSEYIEGNKKSLVTGIKVSKKASSRKIGANRLTTTANELPAVTVAVSFELNGNIINNPIIAVGGIANVVKRLYKAEDTINGKELLGRDELEKLISEEVFPVSDIKGSAQFKKYLSGVLVASTFYEVLNKEME